MRLYIDLSPTEEANIGGWVNKGLADPTFADYPWKIVLEERTRARFDQIAAQFGAAPPALPVNVWAEIPYGDYARRLWAASTEIIDAFPFRVTAGLAHVCMSENGGQPWDRLLTISAVAGDLSSPVRSQGKVPDLYVGATAAWPAGTLLYANTVLMQEPTVPNSSGTGISIVWPAP